MIRIGTDRWTFWVTASAKVLAEWLWHNAYEDSPYPRSQLLFTWFEDEAYESGVRVKWYRYEQEYGIIDLSAGFSLADGRPHGIHAGSGAPVRFRLIPLGAERTEVRAECLMSPAPGLYERFQHVLEEISKQWPTEQKQEERSEDFSEPPVPEHSAQREPGQSMASSNRIFIVHGHDGAARDSVALCIERLGLEAVILHERPDRGRTIIEKFEQYSDVGFAVVLLTPDDLGRAKDEDELKPRARQNVIFELGFFIGKLARDKVCALYKGDVEILSDYQGVLWKSMEGDGWRFDLVRELKAAGFDVDANKLLS